MATASIDEQRLKEQLKSAIVEAIEEVALARAIDEGTKSPVMSREEVYKLFEHREVNL